MIYILYHIWYLLCIYFAVSRLSNRFFERGLALFDRIHYNRLVVIPLITSLISNPNTPFEQNKLLPCGLFCFTAKERA